MEKGELHLKRRVKPRILDRFSDSDELKQNKR